MKFNCKKKIEKIIKFFRIGYQGKRPVSNEDE
jgi:hypothetical protein